MKRRSIILLVLVLAVMLGFAIFIPHGGYRRAVEAYKQGLIARGEKLTVVELIPPRSTNPPNAAMLFFTQSNFPQINPPVTMTLLRPGLAVKLPTNIFTTGGSPYQSNTSRMAEMREVLKVSPLDFHLDFSHVIGVPAPHLISLLQAERLATTTTLQALALKDDAEAHADLDAAVDFVRLYTNEPIIVFCLVRAVNANIALGVTWEILQRDDWTEPQLAELQARWADMDLFKSFDSALVTQRAFGIKAIVEARKIKDWQEFNAAGWRLQFTAVGPGPGPGGGLLGHLAASVKAGYERYRFQVWKSSWSFDEELASLQVLDAAIRASRRIRDTGAFVAALDEYHASITNINLQHPGGTNHFLLLSPSFDGTFEKDIGNLAKIESSRRLLVVAIALKRWQLLHGALPATLNEMVPAVLPQVPVDLMDGKPLRYRLNADGTFLLYSVGTDGRDDGGDPTPTGTGSAIDFLNGRDIVWPRAATAAEADAYYKDKQMTTNAPGQR